MSCFVVAELETLVICVVGASTPVGFVIYFVSFAKNDAETFVFGSFCPASFPRCENDRMGNPGKC